MRIHRHLFEFIGILVAQSGEGMSELVYDHGLESPVMGHGEVVGVVDASSAVLVGVDKYDDMLVWRSCEPVVQVLEVECRQVTVAVEGKSGKTKCGDLQKPNVIKITKTKCIK